MNVSTVTPELAQLMVIGVGVDYALFIVTRHRRNLLQRDERRRTRSRSPSTPPGGPCCSPARRCASRCSGSSRSASASSTAWLSALAIAVGLTMLASLTLLPALLSFLGLSGAAPQAAPRDSGRHLRRRSQRIGFWARWSRSRGPAQGRRSAPLGAARHRRAGHPVLLDAAGPRRPRQRPGRHHDPQGLRPDRAGLRRRATTRPSTLVVSGPQAQHDRGSRSRPRLRTVPDVDPSSVFVPPKPLTERITLVVVQVDRRRRRTRRPPTWSSTCAATCCRRSTDGTREPRLRVRADRDPRRLRQGAVEQDAAVHRAPSSGCRSCCC